jgi:hypothetical protein
MRASYQLDHAAPKSRRLRDRKESFQRLILWLHGRNVRCGSKADLTAQKFDFRYSTRSEH